MTLGVWFPLLRSENPASKHFVYVEPLGRLLNHFMSGDVHANALHFKTAELAPYRPAI